MLVFMDADRVGKGAPRREPAWLEVLELVFGRGCRERVRASSRTLASAAQSSFDSFVHANLVAGGVGWRRDKERQVDGRPGYLGHGRPFGETGGVQS